MSQPNSPKPSLSVLGKLFVNMLYISAFTFGGGFVIVSLMKKKFVDGLHWLTEEEMLDYTALAQSSPGAIAVNGAILVGWRVAGIWGMLVSVLGTILPPMLILMVISYFYQAFIENQVVSVVLMGMQAGVAAVIADVALSLGGKVVQKKDTIQIVTMVAAFIAAAVFKVNVIILIVVAALLGIGIQLLRRGKET